MQYGIERYDGSTKAESGSCNNMNEKLFGDSLGGLARSHPQLGPKGRTPLADKDSASKDENVSKAEMDKRVRKAYGLSEGASEQALHDAIMAETTANLAHNNREIRKLLGLSSDVSVEQIQNAIAAHKTELLNFLGLPANATHQALHDAVIAYDDAEHKAPSPLADARKKDMQSTADHDANPLKDDDLPANASEKDRCAVRLTS